MTLHPNALHESRKYRACAYRNHKQLDCVNPKQLQNHSTQIQSKPTHACIRHRLPPHNVIHEVSQHRNPLLASNITTTLALIEIYAGRVDAHRTHAHV